MNYIVQYRISFDTNRAIFVYKADAIKFAKLIKENFGKDRNFYCWIFEYDLHNQIEY